MDLPAPNDDPALSSLNGLPTITSTEDGNVIIVGDKQIRLVAKRTKSACVNCKAAKVGCGSTRPCLWCIRHGLEDSCVEAPKKARKPRTNKRKMAENESPSPESKVLKDSTDPTTTTTTTITSTTTTTTTNTTTARSEEDAFPGLQANSEGTSELIPQLPVPLFDMLFNKEDEQVQQTLFNPQLTLEQLIELTSDESPSMSTIDMTNFNNAMRPINTITEIDEGNSPLSNVSASSPENMPTSPPGNSNLAPPLPSAPLISAPPLPSTSATATTTTTTTTTAPLPNPPYSTFMQNLTPANFAQNPPFQFPPTFNTNSGFINNMIGNLISAADAANGAPNFGTLIFEELAKIQKAVETISILTSIQSQPIFRNSLSSNTSPFPMALLKLADPVTLEDCNAPFAQLLGYRSIQDAVYGRLDSWIPALFAPFVNRRVRKMEFCETPKKLQPIVIQAADGSGLKICVSVLKRATSNTCIMVIIRQQPAPPELRSEIIRLEPYRASDLERAVTEMLHFKKSVKKGDMRHHRKHAGRGITGCNDPCQSFANK